MFVFDRAGDELLVTLGLLQPDASGALVVRVPTPPVVGERWALGPFDLRVDIMEGSSATNAPGLHVGYSIFANDNRYPRFGVGYNSLWSIPLTRCRRPMCLTGIPANRP